MLLGTAAVAYKIHTVGSKKQPTTSSSDNSSTHVDLSPATPQDQQDSDAHKQAIVQQQSQPYTTASSAVTPIISYAAQSGNNVEVDASVPGVVESGGTCTLTATLSGHTVTRTTTGIRNAQDTSCPAFILDRGDFPIAGDWSIQASYSSAAYNGSSKSQKLTIQ